MTVLDHVQRARGRALHNATVREQTDPGRVFLLVGAGGERSVVVADAINGLQVVIARGVVAPAHAAVHRLVEEEFVVARLYRHQQAVRGQIGVQRIDGAAAR